MTMHSIAQLCNGDPLLYCVCRYVHVLKLNTTLKGGGGGGGGVVAILGDNTVDKESGCVGGCLTLDAAAAHSQAARVRLQG